MRKNLTPKPVSRRKVQTSDEQYNDTRDGNRPNTKKASMSPCIDFEEKFANMSMSQSRIVSQDEPTTHEIEIQLEDRKLLEQIRGKRHSNGGQN